MKYAVKYQGKQPDMIEGLEGVHATGSDIVFEGYTPAAIEGILKRMTGLVRPIGQRNGYKPTDDDRLKVMEITGLEDVSAFGIYRAAVSSTQVDLGRDKFSKAVLDEMAEQYKDGRTVVLGHDSMMGVGKTFDAEVAAKSDGESDYELLVKFYVLPDAQAPTGNLKQLLDARVYDRFSIAASLKMADVISREDSGDGLPIYTYDPSRIAVVHLGIVDMGMNTDAVSKSNRAQAVSFGDINEITEKPRIMQYKFKHIGNGSIDLTEDAVSALLERVEKKFEAQAEKLAAFEDAQMKKLETLRDEWCALRKQIDTDADADKLNRRASLLDEELLSEDIANFKKAVAASKKQLDPKGEKNAEPKTAKPFTPAANL
jgi:hypothetical protein